LISYGGGIIGSGGGVGEGGVLAHLRRLRQHQGEGALGTDCQMDLVAANWDGGANGRERTCGGGLVKVAAGWKK